MMKMLLEYACPAVAFLLDETDRVDTGLSATSVLVDGNYNSALGDTVSSELLKVETFADVDAVIPEENFVDRVEGPTIFRLNFKRNSVASNHDG